MILEEKEMARLKDLQTQEQSCIQKYEKYSEQAKDPELRSLFQELKEDEERHHESLRQAISGRVERCDCNDQRGEEYTVKPTYSRNENTQEKQDDCFLATDCIGTEKMVSSEYNSGVFVFGEPAVRKLLADIQIEEQNHAEMLYKYKTANGMS